MQIAYEIAKGNVKHPAKVKQKHFVLEFDVATESETRLNRKRKRRKMTRQEFTALSKAKWFSATGYKGEK